MNIRPLYDRIIVKRATEAEVTSGGIIIPNEAKEKPQVAVVVAVGSGRRTKKGAIVPVDIVVGDKVLVSKYGGSIIDVDGEDHLIMKEDDVLAVFRDE